MILFLSAFSLKAQPPGFKSVTDEGDFRKKFVTASGNIQTIKSDFVQEKNLSMLSEKINSKGSFLFKKDNMVRMEYTKPYRYLLIINKDKVLIRDEQKSNTFSARGNKLFENINKIIIDCVQGTAMDNKDFKAKAFESEKQYLLTLTPSRKNMQEFFLKINVFIEKKDYSVHKMDMIEPSGDNTLITFMNKQFNTNIPDAEFFIGK